jgi:indole-3-acetate monooxygenase
MEARMIDKFPQEPVARRKILLAAIDEIAGTLRESGPRSEVHGTLAPEAVKALRDSRMFRLKLCVEMGGAEADPVTEMLVLENLAYHDLTSGWCTMVGATAVASLGTFLPPAGIAQVFKEGKIPTA